MLRKLVCAAFVLVVCTVPLLAEEVKATIKKVEPHTLVVTVDGKEHKVKIEKDTKLLGPKGDELKDGLKNPHLKDGVDVTITFEEKGGKKVATQVKLVGK